MRAQFIVAASACAVLTFASCTVRQTEAPALTGPSEFALSLSMNAIPDSISQDGGSQSSIRILARGPDARPVAALPLRVDMQVVIDDVTGPIGFLQDFGTLSARSIVTGSDGIATVVYTAPLRNPSGQSFTCFSVPGVCVSIIATPTASNFQTANPQTVLIRLVPPGVILPPAGTPTAAFTITPPTVNMNVKATFDASGSTPGSGAREITSYSWSFGDGATASGKVVDHTYTTTGTFTVTLTVTNDRGLPASTPKTVDVVASAPPSGIWVNSPISPVVGETVLFNAATVRPSLGRTIVQYNWNFGDNSPTATASGVTATHVFALANTYAVVLTVVDDAGQTTVLQQNVVVGTGNPTATFTAAVTNAATHSMAFDASASTASGSASISSYQWAFGDGTFAGPSASSTTSQTYANTGNFTVTVTVTDSLGRVGRFSTTVAVP